MTKYEKLFEIVAVAVAAIALGLFFAAMAALIVFHSEVSHPWIEGGVFYGEVR
jgi:ABC-type phosphate/phosphonate transport system permease subunit